MHGAQLRIEIGPAAVAVESHGETDLADWALKGVWPACSLDAHYASFAAGPDYGVGLHHGVVLLVDPALGADVGTREQCLEVGGKVTVFGEAGQNFLRRFSGDGRFPRADGAVVKRGIVSEGLVGNVGNQNAVMANAEARIGLDGADDDGIESPL